MSSFEKAEKIDVDQAAGEDETGRKEAMGKERTEDAARLSRPLIRLAHQQGVDTAYMGHGDIYHEIPDQVIYKVLAALGVHVANDIEAQGALDKMEAEEHARLVAPTVLHVKGDPHGVAVRHGVFEIPVATLTLEDGTEYGRLDNQVLAGSPVFPSSSGSIVTSAIVVPGNVPTGYHHLHIECGEKSADTTLIVAPPRIEPIREMTRRRLWGWMVQLYSVRSAGSWGVGDFEDLRMLVHDAAVKSGADYVQINPVHAAEPVNPLTPSPYLPTSRRFVNFTYIRPETIPEYGQLSDDDRAFVDAAHHSLAEANANADRIDRDGMWRLKMPALWRIFKVSRAPERQLAFDRYKREQGEGLDSYALWCLCYDKWGDPTGTGNSWIGRSSKDSPEVRALVNEYPDTLEFYRWLEWIADEQLAAVAAEAKAQGMPVGLLADMAVGVHPQGADVWGNPERYAKGVTVGAPPDFYNQQGQDWSQPPLNPRDLERTGYQAFRDQIRAMFAHAGAVRIDHILGLFRLWWIPTGNSAADGAYVRYDSDIMLSILAIEASRADGVVVGEDLGVVPPQVAGSLRDHGVLGSVIEWFEQRDGAFRDPHDYRELAQASVTTHDLPPTAGYLNYEHVKLREKLGLLAESMDEAMAQATSEHNAMLCFLVDGGWLGREAIEDESAHEQDIIEAMHKALLASPSRLLCAAITDAVGERRAQNMPGTNNEYPNWRVPLADGAGRAVPLEELFDLPRVRSLAEIMDKGVRG